MWLLNVKVKHQIQITGNVIIILVGKLVNLSLLYWNFCVDYSCLQNIIIKALLFVSLCDVKRIKNKLDKDLHLLVFF